MTLEDIVRTKVKDRAITTSDIQLALCEVEMTIKNYCNLNKVPEELKFVWANMAVDLVKYLHTSNSAPDDHLSLEDVSSLKIGDTQINLQGGGTDRSKTLNSHRPNLDGIVMNYEEQLNKFRRLVW